jgi:hypothetical protein
MENATNAVAVVLGILAVSLSAGTVILSLLASRIVNRYSNQLSQAVELIIRHQDEATAYQRKADADALAAGRQQVQLGVVQSSEPPPVAGSTKDRLNTLVNEMNTDMENV